MRIVIKKMNGKFDVLDVQECHVVEEPVVPKETRSTKPRLTERDETQFYPRTGNANYHHDKYFKSVIAAAAETGEHRYWIEKYCNEEVGGWRWA